MSYVLEVISFAGLGAGEMMYTYLPIDKTPALPCGNAYLNLESRGAPYFHFRLSLAEAKDLHTMKSSGSQNQIVYWLKYENAITHIAGASIIVKKNPAGVKLKAKIRPIIDPARKHTVALSGRRICRFRPVCASFGSSHPLYSAPPGQRHARYRP